MTGTKKIMIVDDDEGILDALSMMLEYKGYEVSTCKNGNAILTMEQDFPDFAKCERNNAIPANASRP